MEKRFVITNSQQHRKMADAVKDWELKQIAKSKTLAGTYWVEPRIDWPDRKIIGYNYHFVERYSFTNRDNAIFQVIVMNDGNHNIETNRGGAVLTWSDGDIKCISREQFVAETKVALDKFRLMWKK